MNVHSDPEQALEASRPLPDPAFRGGLGRRLTAGSSHVTQRPDALWAWALCLAASGLALLAVGVLQI